VNCPALTVANSDTSSITGLTLATHVVLCSNGFISNAGVSFTVTCERSTFGISSWTNVLTCVAVACPALTILNSDTTAVNGLTLESHSVLCVDGFTSSAGTSFTSSCVGTASGVSAWSNVLTCNPIACPLLTILNSDTSSVFGNTLDTIMVSCDYGYTSSSGHTFIATCTASVSGASTWSNALNCNTVACPPLTIVNSDTASISGSTLDTHLVRCDAGYTSSAGNTFTSTCSGSGPSVASWSNVLACEPVACSALTVAHSDTNSISGLTLATHLVTCDDGYISPSGTTFVVACVQAAPGVSIWSNVNSCSVVSCPALTVENSDSYFFAGNTLDSHEVTCDYGFISNAGSSFTVTCMGSGPGASDWSGVQSCDAVPCPFLTIVNSDTISVSGFTLDTHVVS